MSLTNPFLLTYVNESGVEAPVMDHYFYVDSEIHLSLKDVFLGTKKHAVYRLYNNLTGDEFQYSTILLKFDISEAFTFFKDVRYDTLFESSLRKFIKIEATVGGINSSSFAGRSYEISSEFHVNVDTPVNGILFINDNTMYNTALLNESLRRKYIIVPYFPNPGEYVPIKISVSIPSEFEDNFLEKALGFPPKQANFKSPLSAGEFSQSIAALQKLRATGGTQGHKVLISTIGPIDLQLISVYGGAAKYPYSLGMLNRASNRGYIFTSFGLEWFSDVTQPILYSKYSLSNPFFVDNPSSLNYYKGLPSVLDSSTGTIELLPDNTNYRTQDTWQLELTTTLFEALAFFGILGEQAETEYRQYAGKLFNIVHSLLHRYHAASGEQNVLYNPALQAGANTSDVYNSALMWIWASALDSLMLGLNEAFPGDLPLGTPVLQPIKYIEQEDCIETYFDIPTLECDFSSLTDKSIWSKPPSQIYGTFHTARLTAITALSLAMLKTILSSLKHAETTTQGQLATLQTSANIAYFNRLSKGFATFISKHLIKHSGILDETKQTGNMDLFFPLDDAVFPAFVYSMSADYILGKNSTISKQMWHFIQKTAYYRGVYTDVFAMLLTHTKPVETISDDIDSVLNDLDSEKISIVSFLSNISEKQSEKLFSLKADITAII